LPAAYYEGDAVIHWVFPVADRRTGWLDTRFHLVFRELMLHAATRQALVCPIYCLMPDHLHFVWAGLDPATRQRAGVAFLRTHLEPALRGSRFQHQAFDHVLRATEREQDAFQVLCGYVAANPVRAGLVAHPSEWEFTGAIVPGYPDLSPNDAAYWPRYWSIYAGMLRPSAREVIRPGLGRLSGL
jgi:REP element-mobilizing transposase RayT